MRQIHPVVIVDPMLISKVIISLIRIRKIKHLRFHRSILTRSLKQSKPKRKKEISERFAKQDFSSLEKNEQFHRQVLICLHKCE